ncbi:complex I subunit 5 family protein [Paraburkholderia rhizosphaerae]|uniref:Multisubunit sodium/proton antiporter MrpD subunit n=1 Tax=Paraburkholderia rhizosphaerae TaxID=480658 RepID=A0A4R8LP10_9BURK|nr:proton-conducting transporter membrane subunit [Paraburkholderia rhizosphaerae]TDY45390.1 multisubunit sodium/proton antiporter MrpD subunit [Paraburkholderia rhizosphaerae]
MTTLALMQQATPGGLLLVLAVLLPFAGMLAGLALGGRRAQSVAWVTIICGLGVVLAIARRLLDSGDALRYPLGGWLPPLGVMLRADGLSVCMMLVVALVTGAVALYANGDFGTPAGTGEARAPFAFWLLLLAVWGSLNLVFVSGDIFTLYVALELLTFAGVPLVSLDGRAETLQAALRYLLFALIGSMLYLLGVFLLYGAYGTLDIALLAERIGAQPLAWAAVALMSAGMLAKTALFPLHLWLPPAHAGAPAAASALLSAIVVKGSWFVIVRLWLDVFAAIVSGSFTQLLAGLGAAAIIFGNVVALRQIRLKLLIAYSTVAQIGYLFLMFPIAAGQHDSAQAVTGGLLQAVSHATAKSAMFLAAGLIYGTLGHDRLADLRGVARALPMTVTAFALAGIALIGLPPSGGFLAKWLLLSAALAAGQWWWALVILVGGLLTSIYVFTVVVRSMEPAAPDWIPETQVPRYRQIAVLGLAMCSFLLGLAVLLPVDVTQIGRTVMSATGMP